MNTETECFLQALLKLYPEAVEKYENIKKTYGCVLETVVIEDVFVPLIIDTINKEEDTELIKQIFDLFEKTANRNDQHFLDVFSTTILECLGNNNDILCKARKYMGPVTHDLQLEADRQLGRI